MGVHWALHDGEVIDHSLLRALASLAEANHRSVVEERNPAVPPMSNTISPEARKGWLCFLPRSDVGRDCLT